MKCTALGLPEKYNTLNFTSDYTLYNLLCDK